MVHLRGIHTLDMDGCTGITDAGLAHLRGIHALNMSCCLGITDAAMEHLCGIHTLMLFGCLQITAAALVQLEGAVIQDDRPPVELDGGENPTWQSRAKMRRAARATSRFAVATR